MSPTERLERALAAIDARNADDPNRLLVRGRERPKEQAHAELASEWIERLAPEAGDALRIAARGHHVRRWAIPRGDYPAGREGYHRWRVALQALHADEVERAMRGAGYGDDEVARARDIVRKRNLRGDAEVQAFEDALCLVFVETQLHALAEKTPDAKLREIARKTLRKMSPRAIELALALPLADGERALLVSAAAPR